MAATRNILTLALLVCATIGIGFVVGWFTSSAVSAPPNDPVLIFVHLSMFNSAKFKEYAGLTKPLVVAAGGSVPIVSSITHLSTKANGDSKDTIPFSSATSEKGILLKFPSYNVAKQWYGSAPYKEAIAVRLEAADTIFTMATVPSNVDVTSGSYVVVAGTVKNGAKLKEYAGKVGATIKKYGGSVMVPPTDRETISDRQFPFVSTAGRRIFILLKFSKASDANSWYADPDYQKLIPIREEAMDAVLSIVTKSD